MSSLNVDKLRMTGLRGFWVGEESDRVSYLISSSSTSKMRVSLGPILGPDPRAP
jgi:hypothetical protein